MINLLLLTKKSFTEIVRLAIEEDLGAGDITTNSTIPPSLTGTGRFISKDSGIICGWPVVREVFAQLNPDIKLEIFLDDGAATSPGETLGVISGPVREILSGERVALNFLQHLSGVATRTHTLVELISEYPGVRLVDTRKTIPGLRALDKYAVRVGGGHNHRHNLMDAVLIKDNHIAAAGSIKKAVESARALIPHTMKIEVEVGSETQVLEALEAGVDIIMLDNMTPAQIKSMVKLINKRALIEVSGNVTEENIKKIAACGVDIISAGVLTHSVKALDISLNIDLHK
ncbi:MAG TPA: carboxylating nicotinate-nucleotide diphosphorylase [Bacillota bacterium]